MRFADSDLYLYADLNDRPTHDLKSNGDRLKLELLQSAEVPLIYVRRVDTDSRFYRFYTPDHSREIFYNIITQTGKAELRDFLNSFL